MSVQLLFLKKDLQMASVPPYTIVLVKILQALLSSEFI